MIEMSTIYIFRVEVKTLPRFHRIKADNIQEAFEKANRLFNERYGGEGEYEIVEISIDRPLAEMPKIGFEVPVTNVRAEDYSFELTLGEKRSAHVFSTISIDRYDSLKRPTCGDLIKVNLELDLAARSVRERLEGLRRMSWKPIVEDGDGPVGASKFSGKPWLSKDMEWPVCPCNKPMQLFLQLDLADLPKDLKEDFGTGLLQMFFCTDCYDMAPFAKSALVRIIQPDGEGKDVEVPELPPCTFHREGGPFPPKLITGWEPRDDYPHGMQWEVDELLDLDDDERDIYDRLTNTNIYRSISGDKLWGWPCWVQSALYPSCPVCDHRMRVVFQIACDYIPYIFGDEDRGWITQCPEHKEQLTFHFDST